MTNVLVKIGDGVEVAADDFLKFCDVVKLEAQAIVSPRAMIALAVLAVPVGKAVVEGVAAAAVDGLNFSLDAQTAALIVQCWPDLLAYLKTLSIQPPKG